MVKLKECKNEEQLIIEFTKRVCNEINKIYGISENEIIKKLDESAFNEMIKERPDMVMYYSPEYWAKDVMQPIFF